MRPDAGDRVTLLQTSLPHNRRVVQRDGTVHTHGTLAEPDALWIEGPVDPELTVVAMRDRERGSPLGCLVNFTLHPTDHGDDDVFSAGWPGGLAAALEATGMPETLFLKLHRDPLGTLHDDGRVD